MTAPMPVVVGVPRSGTTLLRMMLDAHPALAIPPETGFLPELAGLSLSSDAPASAVRLIVGFHTWPDFQLDASAFERAADEHGARTPADVARTFYRMYAARFGKPRWGDKTPTYGAALTAIEALLPEARFVHIIRDGRDVTASVRETWFAPGPDVESCVADWASRIGRTQALARDVSHYLEIRFEDLVMSPASTLRRVCAFLDLDYDDRMLGYHERARGRLDEHGARYGPDGELLVSQARRLDQQRFVMQPPRPHRVGRWRSSLTSEEIARVERVAGDALERLGYELSASRV